MGIVNSKNVEYKQKIEEWETTHRFLTGDDVELELRKGSFEQESRYQIRKEMADFHPLTRNMILRLVGGLFSADIDRDDAGLIPDSFYVNSGINGEDYDVLLYKLVQTAISYNRVGIGVKPGNKVEIIPPINIPRWNEEGIIVKGKQNITGDLTSSEMLRDVWSVHYPYGYEVYGKDDDGNDTLLSTKEYGVTMEMNDKPTSPYFMSNKLWNNSLGYELARTHRSIFRLRSALDAGVVEAINSSVIQAAVGEDEDFAQSLSDALKKNKAYIPYDKELGEHKPLSLPTGPLEQGDKMLNDKIKELKDTVGHFGNNVQTNSATESIINAKSGIDAILVSLGKFVASIEEEILKRVAIMNDITLNNSDELNNIKCTYPTQFIST